MRDKWVPLASGLLVIASVEASRESVPEVDPVSVLRRPNILVIVGDDVGVDVFEPYGEGFAHVCSGSGIECHSDDDCRPEEDCLPNLPPTPTIERLANDGILFRNVWGNPTCSPTRATIQTGRYGFRTGVLYAYQYLPLEEITIPEVLTPPIAEGDPVAVPLWRYTHAGIGKWHLGGGTTGPNNHGYSHFAGTEDNISDYFEWLRTVDGHTDWCYEYATTQNVDDALAWINQQRQPWFMWLAYNAAHSPFQAPPDELHSYHGVTRPDLPVDEGEVCPSGSRRLCYLASIEAMDREIGRLLDSLTPYQRENTTVIFVGDNGTPSEVTAPPFDPSHAKFTVYEGGVNVPMIISGHKVLNPGRESNALVNTTDLFATILELAGIKLATALPPDLALDSVSVIPIMEDRASGSLRDFVYTENMQTQTVRNKRGYKLIRKSGLYYELYDLVADPWETTDLYDDAAPDLTPEAQENFDKLLIHMLYVRGELPICLEDEECDDLTDCYPADPCDSIDTGDQACQREDGTLFACPTGETVHAERCMCTGGPTCPLYDQHLTCE